MDSQPKAKKKKRGPVLGAQEVQWVLITGSSPCCRTHQEELALCARLLEGRIQAVLCHRLALERDETTQQPLFSLE